MYARINSKGVFTGFTNKYNEKKCVNLPIKPLVNMESAVLNEDRTGWDYVFEKVNPTTEETPFALLPFTPSIIYSHDICPTGGDVCLTKDESISILIPCYNKAQYIEECILSCVNQTMKPTQIVVLLMDDKSIAMKNYLESLDSTVECIPHERVNASEARTILVNEYCLNDWFIFLDGDDYLKNNFIEECYKTEGSLIFPRIQYVSEDGEIDKDVFLTPSEKMGHPSGCLKNNLTVLMHKDVFESVGLDKNLAKGGEDFDFFVRLLQNNYYKISLAKDTCYYYRQTMGLTHSHEFFESHLNAVNKNLEYLHTEFNKEFKFDAVENYYYNNPTLEDFAKLFYINENILIKEKIDNLRYRLYLSKQKTPMRAFSEDEFVVVGNASNIEDYSCLEFDVLFCEEITEYNMCNPDLGMVINKDIAEDENFQNLSGYNRIKYLLDNYSCFEQKVQYSELMTEEDIVLSLRLGASDNEIISKQFELIDSEKITLDETQNGIPLQLAFTLHKECNLNCEYCNMHGQTDDLTDDEVFENFDNALTSLENKLADTTYYPTISILGGEATLWSDYLIQKILKRLEAYNKIMLFLNGTNLDSLWYKQDKAHIVKHIVDWKECPDKLKRVNLGKNETAIIVVTHQEVSDAEQFFSEHDDIHDVFISGCANAPDSSMDSTIEDIDRLNNICIERGEASDTLNTCENIKALSIDCTTMQCKSCCRHTTTTTLDDAFNEIMSKDTSKCQNCVLYQMKNNL